ncbi:hypothetical protein N7493_009714 [Penicillium malachiteum]|uniref:Uncharacterized protein n=1 Tax=Penicillium malachiteum TaxID=1324776 RepID=A0AAD6MSI1_9EURO|nr:hypothetical protein N7493_009714 [Penicillium malachiteum]
MTSHTIPGDWERPPKGYDWYRDTNVARTQADSLPQAKIRPGPLARKLKAPDDYEAWRKKVKAILTIHGLADLIDVTVDRPKTTDTKGKQWKYYSLVVAKWLKRHTSPDVLKELEKKHPRFIFADEVFHAIEAYMDCASPHADAEALADWEKMCVTDFSTTSKFIDGVLLAMRQLNECHMFINPYAVFMKIIYGIGINNNDIKTQLCNDWVNQKRNPKKFTALDLELMVHQIKQELSAVESGEDSDDVSVKSEPGDSDVVDQDSD